MSFGCFNRRKITCFIFVFQLEPYMTEKFLLESFELMGEQPRTINVMRKNGLPAGYGFCQFQDKKQATEALHKLNGKIIPNSQPV
jgi:RNA recognition motif-containing protein